MALEMDKLTRPPGDEAFRRENLKGTQWEPTYAGALSFMRRKYTRDLTGVDIAVTGVPFDQAVSHRSGTRMGPEGIRKASAENAWGPFWPWMFDPFDTLAVADYGDCFFDWGKKEDFPATLENHTAEILKAGAETITLGGDHYISYPVLRAYHKKHGALALVHFDAHRDVEIDNGGRIDHGTMFGYAVREGLIDPNKSVQIGIRTLTQHCREQAQRFGVEIIPMADFSVKAVPSLSGPVYISLDLDGIDPSEAPGVSHPEPGGLRVREVLAVLRSINAPIIGADIVELNPSRDIGGVTAILAAKLIREIASRAVAIQLGA